MFRRIIISLAFLLLALLCACNNQESVGSNSYTVSIYDGEYIINRTGHEIIYNAASYKFDINGNEVTITFPDSSTYWEVWQGGSAYGGWSDNFDMDNYTLANNLIKALSSELPRDSHRNGSGGMWAPLFLILLGGFSLTFPYASWYISYGWHYKNAEPSDAAVVVTRISGGIAVLFGFILLFI